jgi:hypothetical protein
MKKTLAVLVMVIMAVGFDWSLLQGSHDKVQVAGEKGSRVTYMTSASTLSYQGQKTQNRVKTASLAKIERQTSSSGGATYALSGEGAVMVGKKGEVAFYEVSPLNVNRSAADRLSSDRKGLSPWLEVVNSTLNGLTHKHMAPGAWEEPIKLPFGEAGPEMIRAKFRARPLPAPDSKWILITADSGLISFRPLDEEYQETMVYGRYQGVLVYAPAEDELLQAAAAFTFYHGEDQFRIEQIHYSADANGNQLYPALDVGPFLNFKPEDSAITTPGPFPSWCIQAAYVLDILHLAVMTAAEGSTNFAGVSFAEQSFLNLIHHHFDMVKQLLKNGGAQDFMGQWSALLMKVATKGIGDWGFWLWDVVSLDLPVMGTRMTAPGNWWVDINKPLYVSAKKMINGKLYDIKLINDFPYGPPAQTAQPVQPTQPTTPVPAAPAPPPDKVKKAPASAGGDSLLWLEAIAGALGLVAGAYQLGLFGGGGEDVDCEWWYSTVNPHVNCKAVEGSIYDDYTFSVPLECGCPTGTKDTGSRSTNPNGMKMMTCKGCFY